MCKLIQVKNVVKSYGQEKVIKRSSFELFKGEVLVVMGSSGAGKSTLLNLITQLEAVDEGEIIYSNMIFEGVHVPFPFVFQSTESLLPWKTVFENITLVNPSVGALEIEEILKVIGLDAHKNKKPGALSGGMKQRLALARAIVCRSKILILDEPFSGLDEVMREKLQCFVLELKKIYDLTIILVTHDRDEAAKMGSRVIDVEGKPIEI